MAPVPVRSKTRGIAYQASLHLDFAAEEEFSLLRRYAFADDHVTSAERRMAESDDSTSSNDTTTTAVANKSQTWDMLADLTQDPMIQQVSEQFKSVEPKHPFPQTISEAMGDPRPTMVTSSESPYKILHVNDAWVSLCGYQPEESIGHTVGQLLQGPETERFLARELVGKQLQNGPFSQAVLTNYTKQGRKFANYVKVGKMADPNLMYVAILQEISSEAHELEEAKTMMGR